MDYIEATAAFRTAAAAFGDADRVWGELLQRQFGKRAGDVRYTPEGEGEPGSVLRRAYEARRTAEAAWAQARATVHEIDEAARLRNAQRAAARAIPAAVIDSATRAGKPTRNVLQRAVEAHTLDAGARIIMDALGIDTGDVAGQHFAGADNERRWTHGHGSDRASMLAPWLADELAEAGTSAGPMERTAERPGDPDHDQHAAGAWGAGRRAAD